MKTIFWIIIFLDLLMAVCLFGLHYVAPNSTVSGIHSEITIEPQINSSQPIKKEKAIETKRLYSLAQSKLNDLVSTGYWSHTNNNGCDFHCRTNGYTWNGGIYSWIGENLYRGKCDADNAYKLWRLSPAHNAVLEHDYDEEVLLHASYGDNKCYYVLIRGILK